MTPLSLHWTVFICPSESILHLSSPGSVIRETDLKGPNSLVLWVLVGFGQLEALRGDLGAIEERGWGIYSSSSFPARLMGFRWLRFSIKSHSSCWMELQFWPGSSNQSLLLPIQGCECKGPPMVASPRCLTVPCAFP